MTASFLDMQASMGISKHQGGLRATHALLDLCHAETASDVLDVGCGIGVGPARIARTYGCRVAGVDLSEPMIGWARRRADEEGVGALVDLRVADVVDLPFDDDRFDVTICESVLAFVRDKERAIREMVRVTRPGGHVGLNEAFLRADASPRTLELASGLGTELVSIETWRRLWAESGLVDRVVRTYRLDPAREVRDRMRWIGLPWLLRGWARVARLYLTEPSLRPAIQVVAGAMKERTTDEPGAVPVWASLGYGLFVGRKEVASARTPARRRGRVRGDPVP